MERGDGLEKRMSTSRPEDALICFMLIAIVQQESSTPRRFQSPGTECQSYNPQEDNGNPSPLKFLI